MSFIKFLPHAGIIAILAALMQFMDMSSTFGGGVDSAGKAIPGVQYFYGWVGFAAWACYFLNGCTVKGGVKVIGCWIAGIIASIAIYELGGSLTGVIDNPKIGYPVAVGIIAFLVILFEKVPALDFIPAWFIGAACFFALTNHVNQFNWKLSIAPILISCIVGQVFGYVTVALRTAYGKMCEEATDSEPNKDDVEIETTPA